MMRTEKRHTRSLLMRYQRLRRGTGEGVNYIPYHRVSRGDPASHGRSHLHVWRERQRELLSDNESTALLFATMMPGVVDIREQFRLSHDPAPNEVHGSLAHLSAARYPGTVAIADELKLKHPLLKEKGVATLWPVTTDLLVSLKRANGTIELVAVAVKPEEELTKRKRQLLAIERSYWLCRDVDWLLVTPAMFDELVSELLRRSFPWGLGVAAPEAALNHVVATYVQLRGRTLTSALFLLRDQLGSLELAQRAFWQAVWTGRVRLDLRRGWWPHVPLKFVDAATFDQFNPITSRRTAWKA